MVTKNLPLVSVLTTVFNREKYLKDCIESVLNSSFEDWEMIIVDDQSTDNSVALAKDFAQKDSRIKVHVNSNNLGDYPNRNKAASLASGKYLKFLDADDLIYPHGLEIMVETMEKFPEAALGISQKVAEDNQPFPFAMSPEESFMREFLKRGVLSVGPTATILRRDIFESLGGFTGTRYIGDVEMWYEMALRFPVVKIVPGLIFWRQHDDQEITKGMQSYFYLENAFKNKMNILKNPLLPLNEFDTKKAEKKLMRRFSRDIFRLIFKGHFTTANNIRKKCDVSWFQIIQAAR